MSKLEIVWRNPEPITHTRRQHTVDQRDDHTLWTFQEGIECEGITYWTTICNFEVWRGGRAA